MKKIFLSIVVLLFILWWGAYFYFSWEAEISEVKANPDYICTKAVSGNACEEWICSNWESWMRTCYWKMVTEVAYILRRTSCETGYDKKIRWSSDWNSGRQGVDYPNKSEICEYIEVDNTPPVWEILDMKEENVEIESGLLESQEAYEARKKEFEEQGKNEEIQSESIDLDKAKILEDIKKNIEIPEGFSI